MQYDASLSDDCMYLQVVRKRLNRPLTYAEKVGSCSCLFLSNYAKTLPRLFLGDHNRGIALQALAAAGAYKVGRYKVPQQASLMGVGRAPACRWCMATWTTRRARTSSAASATCASGQVPRLASLLAAACS